MITKDDIKNYVDYESKIEKRNWNGLELEIKNTISIKEMIDLVKFVVDMCFAKDTYEYLPEVRDFASSLGLILKYTNIELPNDDLSFCYDLIYNSDILDIIYYVVDEEQIASIKTAIDRKLKYLCNSNIEALNKQFEKLYGVFESLGSQFSNVFNEMGNESMTELMDAIKNGGLDEEKLVEAYIKNTKENKSGD